MDHNVYFNMIWDNYCMGGILYRTDGLQVMPVVDFAHGTRTCVLRIRRSSRSLSEWWPTYFKQFII